MLELEEHSSAHQCGARKLVEMRTTLVLSETLIEH
jgi:hypothetical protein